MKSNGSGKSATEIIRRIRNRGRFLCPDCTKSFARESTYVEHQCEPKKRKKQLKTIVGQAALSYYQQWMKYRKVPIINPVDYFIRSLHYYSLMSFAAYAKQAKITNFDLFLNAMDNRGWIMFPYMWKSQDAHTAFAKYIDIDVSPIRRVEMTIDYLWKIAAAAEVDISEVFTVLEPGEFITLIESRKLSPWFLLLSKKFYAYYDSLSEEQKEIVSSFVDPVVKKLEDNSKLREKFKKYVVEMDL